MAGQRLTVDMDMAYLLGPLDMVLLSTLFRIVGLSGRAFVADPSDGGAEGAEADAQRAATASSDVSYGVDGGNPVMASSSPSSTHEATEESSPAGASFGRRDPDPASPSSSFSQYEASEQASRDDEEMATTASSYAPGETMGDPGAKMYCVVEFPKSNLTGCTVVGATDPKLVAIPLCEQRCEKGCCSIKTLPLRVCYALTVHKVQGMSIGPGETFEKAVVHFAEGRMANIPGLMLTAFTRVKNAGDLAIGTDSNSLAVETITKIGTTKAYQKKKEYRQRLGVQSQQSMQRTVDRITALDNENTRHELRDTLIGCTVLPGQGSTSAERRGDQSHDEGHPSLDKAPYPDGWAVRTANEPTSRRGARQQGRRTAAVESNAAESEEVQGEAGPGTMEARPATPEAIGRQQQGEIQHLRDRVGMLEAEAGHVPASNKRAKLAPLPADAFSPLGDEAVAYCASYLGACDLVQLGRDLQALRGRPRRRTAEPRRRSRPPDLSRGGNGRRKGVPAALRGGRDARQGAERARGPSEAARAGHPVRWGFSLRINVHDSVP
ncbi:hypothetical protein THAOC_06340 [Thalassiosira oceanica]|uniref:Uncharacterized protein n=1 Tax=Thalassiosira oceanica TaxID=159749 RepID=K0TLU9_THAOC|nr:hypothetical protein THAOC_06340 [Thalassiosira oceanica]|eukprot:EJK72157.1 hypothetical protein THAOC_06340 [Thalassiosira oceanica]